MSDQYTETTALAVEEKSASEVSQVVDHFFRHEAGRVVATLTGIFGIHNLQLAEDAVQEALLKAMQVWSFGKTPANPSGWIMQVSRNFALDRLRREQNFRSKEEKIVESMEPGGAWTEAALDEDTIFDDQLRMMFTCCHPIISREDQVALTLKTLCGFSGPEIAAAFLTSEPAIAKRLVRAKQRIREARVAYEIPTAGALVERLDSVLQTLYLVFNEGYKASHGEELVRCELVQEAIRLAELLVRHPAGNRPRVHALLALMLLAGARLPARIDDGGSLLLLSEQDRSRWDRRMIRTGLEHLAESAAGDDATEYHLQAAIAACHCLAPDFASTDWERILSCYDGLLQLNASPVIALNRAVALAKVRGPRTGLEEVRKIKKIDSMESYYLFYAVSGQFHLELNDLLSASADFARALELTTVASERNFLSKKLSCCQV